MTFTKDDPAQWPNTLIAFCTVQDNTSFGADFRIAKTWEAADPTRFRLNCFAASFGAGDTCTDTLQPSAPIVPDAATKVRLLTRVYAPDTVNCKIVGGRASDLKIRLVRDFPPGTVAAGGTTSSFTYTTGPRSGIGNGFHQTYFLEVDFKDGAQHRARGIRHPMQIRQRDDGALFPRHSAGRLLTRAALRALPDFPQRAA